VQIEEYISELLFEHNCVIVPDFGGFIGNYSPSRIDPVKHLFEPPHKKVLFNKGLTQNDGLLAHHISKREKVSYAEALEHITKAVKHYQTELKQNKRIALDFIGVLYTDEQGNLLFQQDEKVNYLPEAFGLSAFYQLPVVKEGEQQEEGKVVQLHPAQRNLYRNIAAAAAIGAVVASTFWISLNQSKLGIDYSSLNIFAKKEAKQYSSVPREALPTAKYTQDSIAIANIPTTKSVVIDNTPIATGNFQIVAGCFKIQGNAQAMINRMKQHNINAAIIGTSTQGLYMVGYGKFNTKEEAELSVNEFRKTFVADAWVFEKAKG